MIAVGFACLSDWNRWVVDELRIKEQVSFVERCRLIRFLEILPEPLSARWTVRHRVVRRQKRRKVVAVVRRRIGKRCQLRNHIRRVERDRCATSCSSSFLVVHRRFWQRTPFVTDEIGRSHRRDRRVSSCLVMTRLSETDRRSVFDCRGNVSRRLIDGFLLEQWREKTMLEKTKNYDRMYHRW